MGCNVSKDVKVEDQGNPDKNDDAENGGEKPEMSEEKAAEKIQASFRGYKTRKVLKDNGVLPAKQDKNQSNGEIDEKTEELPEHPEEKIAAKHVLSKQDEEDIAAIDLTDTDLEKAAAKIQASYRHFTKKKQNQESPSKKQEEPEQKEEKPVENGTKDEENLDDIDLKDPEVEKAALKIQSTFRGYKVRKEVKGEDGEGNEEAPLTNGEKGEDEE